MERIYSLEQVFTDPRTGRDYSTGFEVYVTRAFAMAAAKKLKGRWRIVEQRVVATSENPHAPKKQEN